MKKPETNMSPERKMTGRPWVRPELRKLPVSATAGAGGGKGQFNEGQGGGKGDSGPTPIS